MGSPAIKPNVAPWTEGAAADSWRYVRIEGGTWSREDAGRTSSSGARTQGARSCVTFGDEGNPKAFVLTFAYLS